MARTPGEIERAAIRLHTYSETGGAWLSWIEMLTTMIFVVHSTIFASIIFFLCVRVLRCFVGYADLHHTGWIAYRTAWYSDIAPAYTRLKRVKRQ